MEVVCTIDENYISHCGVMLKSLFFNNPKYKFNVYIIHNGICNSGKTKLHNFIVQEGHIPSFIEVDESLVKNAPVTHHVSLATYYRILIPLILKQSIEKVLFLDSDLIVRNDISELWNTDLKDNFVGACLEYVLDNYKINLGLKQGTEYFNAGVLLINLKKWREEQISDKILDYITHNSSKLISWDQDALNVAFENKWKKLNVEWNVGQNFYRVNPLHEYFDLTSQKFNQLKTNPSIVHFTGSDKPWHFINQHPLKSDYLLYKSLSPWKKDKLIGEPGINDKAIHLYKKGKSFLKRKLFKK